MLEINQETVIVDLHAPDAEAVICCLAECLSAQGLVDRDYAAAVLARERAHPTGLPTKPFPVALPHADARGVHRSALAVASLRQAVVFRNMADPDEELQVVMVFMLANRDPNEQIRSLRNLAQLFSQPEKLDLLRGQSTPSEIVAWLKRELDLSPDMGGRLGLGKEASREGIP